MSTNAEARLGSLMKNRPQLRSIAAEMQAKGLSAKDIVWHLENKGHLGKFWIKKWFSHDEDSGYEGEYHQNLDEMNVAFEKMKKIKAHPYIECFEYDKINDDWIFTGHMWSGVN